jgi:replicative superfamily II helicase
LEGRKNPRPIRFVGLSCPIANGKDVASWLGVSTDVEEGGYFNFSPNVRQKNLEAVILSFD